MSRQQSILQIINLMWIYGKGIMILCVLLSGSDGEWGFV